MATLRSVYTLAAFDTGERTGYAVVAIRDGFDPRAATSGTFDILGQGVLTVKEVARELKRLIAQVDLVAYETWRLFPDYAHVMIGNDMQPSQVVGMVRYEAWQQNKDLASYGAYAKKPAVRTMPQWLKYHMARSSEQHDQDAIMHAWYVASKNFYDQLKLEDA